MDTSASDPAAYFSADTCELDEFLALVSRSLSADEVRLAVTIEKNIPIYDMSVLRAKLGDPGERQSVMAEWAYVLHKQSGVIVLRNAYKDTAAIDAASEVYKAIIAKEKTSAVVGQIILPLRATMIVSGIPCRNWLRNHQRPISTIFPTR